MAVIESVRGQLSVAPSKTIRYLPSVALAADLGVIVASVCLAIIGRESMGIFDPTSADVSARLGVVGPLLPVGWIVCIHLLGGYRRDVFGAGTDEFKRVSNAGLLTAGLLGVTALPRRHPALPRLLLPGLHHRHPGDARLPPGDPPGAAAGPRQRLPHPEGPASPARRRTSTRSPSVLRRETWLGYDIVGAVTARAAQPGRGPARPPGPRRDRRHHRARERAPRPTSSSSPAARPRSASRMRELVWELEQHDVQVVVAPERHRRLGRAREDPPRRRTAADAPRAAHVGQRRPGRQAHLRHRSDRPP